MSGESATEPVVSEPVAEVPATTESVSENGSNGSEWLEGVKIEESPTAQPAEPLESEPEPTWETAPEPTPEPSVPQEPTTVEPEPIPEPQPEPVPPPEPVSGPTIQTSTQYGIQTNLARELLTRAREAIQFRKRKKLEKIMSLFLKKSEITNDEVEKLLHVSDATATRYLSQLEKEGRIRQTGTAKGSVYSRI